MDAITRCRAFEAFCRQRAKMADENEHFWLTQADSWAKRLSNGSIDELEESKTPPNAAPP
ncbi:hypothetical protein KMZ29_21230 [Bradyrhizobium sediminis]|uniref:Uncharacterized protein n=1 Tax=Bradyrhizobium sediminis TaxID=2840469 RepID=A0A975NCC8_9BRAD|nr:hypothetical protein [Bradyrhizobium sediminis]QWG12215.1 hypothetical protein KMZ29_21230 [Bradyrhizobium sediminis]